jgi:hypothetical protein
MADKLICIVILLLSAASIILGGGLTIIAILGLATGSDGASTNAEGGAFFLGVGLPAANYAWQCVKGFNRQGNNRHIRETEE